MTSEPSRVANVTCTFCDCTCDDIILEISNEQISHVERACELGQVWFQAHSTTAPLARVRDQVVPLSEAVTEAARLLQSGRYPIIYGLVEASSEAQRLAVELADRLGAVIDSSRSWAATGRAMTEAGSVAATLGEIRNRAELVIYWGCDPQTSHPRHLARFAQSTGLFVSNRHIVQVGDTPNRTSAWVNEWLQCPWGQDWEYLSQLRLLLQNHEVPSVSYEWRQLVERMRSVKCGAIFYGRGLTESPGGSQHVAAVVGLARDLNRFGRFYALPLIGYGNAAGLASVLAWQTGYSAAVSFAQGYPKSCGDEYSAESVLQRGEADVALLIGADATNLSSAAQAHLRRIPLIAIDFRDSETMRRAVIAIRTSTYGLHAAGTVHRADGVSLPLRPSLQSDAPSDQAVMRAILDALTASGSNPRPEQMGSGDRVD